MPPMASTVLNNAPRQPEPQTSPLLLLPSTIFHRIFLDSGIPTYTLWAYRTVCKRLAEDDHIHKHLLAHLREITTPFPRTLILEPAPVPVGFLYNIVLALLGHDHGRAFWHGVFQQASPGDVPSSPLSPFVPAAIDHDAAMFCLLNRLRREHAEIREAHFWSFLTWYRERGVLSLRDPADPLWRRRRRDRLEHAFRQESAEVLDLSRVPHLAGLWQGMELDLNWDKPSLRAVTYLTRESYDIEASCTGWPFGWVEGTSTDHVASWQFQG
ncbi:hypothetical protein CkaCkLH20_00046 [Colletotrichum karsti]|uniref:Uncharacterized protein n=1 Tax=Colletotrichum karsti TaxID=1095194 RepID=A0A9P6IJW7_9PEZI|nr:uncharacterized protein CkaCkLH20_00046 [Colletotrichum karsti]KAF9882010.1 hypothetical protein CkaCkLH20_00046 [Colletotrichum karsti]